MFLESYNIKTSFSMNFEISMKPFPFPFENMRFNPHLLKTFKKKLCINYTKKSMWNCLNFKDLKMISHGQGVLLLLISKKNCMTFWIQIYVGVTLEEKNIQFHMWQSKFENMKRFSMCLKAFSTWDYHPKEWFIKPKATLSKLTMMYCHY